MAELYLTTEQAADRLQLHPETIRRQIHSGRLRAVRRGRVYRIPESAIGESSVPAAAGNRWAAAAERMAPIYAASLAQGDDFTASTTAPGNFYDGSEENTPR